MDSFQSNNLLYRTKKVLNTRKAKRMILIIIFLILIYISLFTGPYNITIRSLIRDEGNSRIAFRYFRLPRTLAVILAASGLSVAGLIMQSISRNKFMAPSTTGANDAALLGIVIGFVFLSDVSATGRTMFAFVFSFSAIMIFTLIVNSMKAREAHYVPLLGMMFGAVLAAITGVIARRFDILQEIQGLTIGTFNTFSGFGLIWIIAIPLVIITIYAHKFSIIGMGEDFSKNLGVNYKKIVFIGLLCVAMVSATVTVSVGILPFVGLIIPNLVSTIYGDNIKKSLFDLMIFGSAFLLFADIISRVILPQGELPVGLTISVLGGVVFLVYMIGGFKNGKTKKS